MNKNLNSYLLLFALIAGGSFAVYALSGFLEKNRPALPENYADEDLSLQGAKLKGYALGFEGLLADWYWMKSLQYLGDKIINSKESYSIDNLNSLNPRLLYPYLNNAADLDPKFISVYEFGATVLPAIDKEQAIKLTRKGIDNNPDNWRLYHYLGYIYWRLNDYEKASETYAEGSQIPDAPPFMKSMAARMKSEGGNRETARAIYRQLFDEARDSQSRDNAAMRLKSLEALDELDTMQKAIGVFKLKNNRCPAALREILPLLKDEKLPAGNDFNLDELNNLIDPTGVPYILNKEICQVKVDLEKSSLPPN